MENIPYNDRGFKTGKFTDGYGNECSIQESSRACIEGETEGWYIWLGMDNPKIMKDTRSGPGTQVTLDENHDIFSRMHLSQRQVEELIPHLQYFVETGYLPTLEEHDSFVKHLNDNDVQATIKRYFEEVSN